MIISKTYIGKHECNKGFIHYYLINKDSIYGIELVEENEDELTSTYEWFTENSKSASAFGKRLCTNGALPIQLSELVDDYVE